MEELIKKFIFEPNVWIKFESNGITCVGRTIAFEDKQIVSFTSSIGVSSIIDFHEIQNPTKLTFVKDTDMDVKIWGKVKGNLRFYKHEIPVNQENLFPIEEIFDEKIDKFSANPLFIIKPKAEC